MSVQASYAISAQLSPGVWTDISGDVIGRITCSWGIPRNGPIDFLAMTGTMQFTLTNASGQYSPNSASPLSGWAKGVAVKLEFTYDNLTHRRFYGVIDDFHFDASGPTVTNGRIVVTVVDWMGRAAKYPVNYPNVLINKTIDQAVQIILNSMPTAPLATNLAAGTNTFPVVFDTVTDFTYAATEFTKLCLSELCYMYLRKDNTYGETLVLENANSRVAATAKVIPIVSDDAGFLLMETGDFLLLETGDKIILDDTQAFTANNNALRYETSYGDNLINEIKFRYIPRTYGNTQGVNGMIYRSPSSWVNTTATQYALGLSLAAGETKTFKMKYGYFSAVQSGDQSIFKNVGSAVVAKVGQPYPTNYYSGFTSMYTTANPSDAAAVNITADLSLVSLVCRLEDFEITLKNNNAAKGYVDLWIEIGSGGAAIAYGPEILAPIVQDAASISQNDHQPLQFDQLYQIAGTAGNSFANSVLANESNPRTVLNRIHYNANRSAYYMEAFLSLDIGDLFPAQDTNKGINGNFFVQDFQFSVDPQGVIYYSIGVKEYLPIVMLGSVATKKGSAASTINWSHTVAAGNNRLLVVDVTLRGSESISSIDYGGNALTLKSSKSFGPGSGDPRVERWYLLSPAVGTATITVTASGASFLQAGSIDFANVNQGAPFGIVVSDSGTGGTPSVTVVGALGDMTLDVIGVATGTITPDTSQVSRWNISSDGAWRGGGSTEAGSASAPMSWTLGGANKWALLAVAIKKA